MRPAHSAREIHMEDPEQPRVRDSFNEARAFSAGNRKTSEVFWCWRKLQ